MIRLFTPNYTVGAVAVCEDSTGRVLLVRSRQHGGWGLPGGLVRRGEQPVDALVREIAEELSIVVTVADLAHQASHTLIDPDTQQVTVVVTVPLAGPPDVDGAEVVEARWFDPADLPSALVRGTLEALRAVGARAPRTAP